MRDNEMSELYFDWLCSLVCETPSKADDYSDLLHMLHNFEFTFSLEMGGNRFEDGIQLRYVYGTRHNISDAKIARLIDYKPCSVLEMMVAVAVRCEDTIMANSEFGNRTCIWFWSMIESMGLIDMDNTRYNEVAEFKVDMMLSRSYRHNGAGGLFTLERPPRDMRDVDIWCQLMWWLNEYEKE